MALYTQKFIAADYLAGVQTQTLLPSATRETSVARGIGDGQERAKLSARRVRARERDEMEEQLGRAKRRYCEREGGKLPDDGCGSSSFPLVPLARAPSRRVVHAFRSSPTRLNLAEAGNHPEKTRVAFYRRTDYLNNSQHGNPSPICATRMLSPARFLPFLALSLSRGSPFPYIPPVAPASFSNRRDPTCLAVPGYMRDLCASEGK